MATLRELVIASNEANAAVRAYGAQPEHKRAGLPEAADRAREAHRELRAAVAEHNGAEHEAEMG